MPWEIISKEYQSKSTNPLLTISPLGRCTLNRAAAAMFEREAVEQVLIMWDRETLKIGIRPITKKDPRSFSVRYARKDKVVIGGAFSGVLFLKQIGYDYSTTKIYPITWNADESIFVVELPQERFTPAQQPLIAVEGGKRHGKAATGD